MAGILFFIRSNQINSRIDAEEMEENARRREAVENLRAAIHIRTVDGFFLQNEKVESCSMVLSVLLSCILGSNIRESSDCEQY